MYVPQPDSFETDERMNKRKWEQMNTQQCVRARAREI